ncbi:hypothetical protein [Spirosoma koreense]
MKYLYLIVLFIGFASVPSSAQKKTTKVYVAQVDDAPKAPSAVQKRRDDEITFQAKSKINNNLLDLFNTLTADSLGDSERNAVINNSFLPNPAQIFYSDGVIIEDDIDPAHNSAENTVDLGVERYLRNLDLFYAKSDTFSIVFSQVITSKVEEAKDFPYIKVFFTSYFKGKYTQGNIAYRPVQRVAELRAERIDGKWRTFIVRLGFLKPGEGISTTPSIGKDSDLGSLINSPEMIFQSRNNPTDSITVKWDNSRLSVVRSSTSSIPSGIFKRSKSEDKSAGSISIKLSREDHLLTFNSVNGHPISFDLKSAIKPPNYRLRGWLQIASGIISLGASYAGYSSLHNSYNDYASKLTALNAEYAVWQSLSQQPGSNPVAPMPFSDYARPGIYAVYGGGIVGGGLLINGIRQLIKAGQGKAKIQRR